MQKVKENNFTDSFQFMFFDYFAIESLSKVRISKIFISLSFTATQAGTRNNSMLLHIQVSDIVGLKALLKV